MAASHDRQEQGTRHKTHTVTSKEKSKLEHAKSCMTEKIS